MRLVATAAPDSSGHYRIRQPIEALRAKGSTDYEAIAHLPIAFALTGPKDVHLPPDVEVVVLQRPMMYFMPAVIDVLHAKGIKVAVDLDDDFHTAHANNKAFQLNHPKRNQLQNWNHLGECVKRADLVTVSTDALAKRYGSHGRVAVIRNAVDDDWLKLPHRGDGCTLGWAGTVVNHPVDLQATRGGVAMALDDHPSWKFFCIGGAKYSNLVQKGLELKEEPLSTEWRPLELHPMLVSAIDVGIVPLHESVFNAAKSWLKGLEYSALGIPFVASDLPEYKLLKSRFELGVLAESRARTWHRRLNVIMDDDHLKSPYEAWARSIVRQYLTISVNAWRWQEAWETLRCRPARDARHSLL